MLFLEKLAAVGPTIKDICNVSGIAGVSLGILHNNEIVHTASFGYADVERNVLCDSDTTFVLGSLSKAMTAAILGSLHDDGIITSWDSQLQTILPEFHREDIYGEITLTDLLTHRTGLAPLDALWLASDNVPFLTRSDALQILNGAPGVQPFRSHFLYNNFAYEILGQVIEKLSNSTFSEALQKFLLDPLGMTGTCYTGESRHTEAKPYAALEDASVVPIAPALVGDNVLMGPAGGVRSSVNDLLILYKAFMKAAHDDLAMYTDTEAPSRPQSPIRSVRQLWHGKVPLPSSSPREHSYAFSWARAQLPSILTPGDDGPSELNPIVGSGTSSRLVLYYGGNIPRFSTYNALFPETNSAVVVLMNSMSLNDGIRWIGELLVEALFDNLQNAPDYRLLAQKAVERSLARFRATKKSLAAGRTVETPSRDLSTYVGSYQNAAGNFFLRIQLNQAKDGFQVSYMGRRRDTFDLTPYQEDSFYWALTYDETVKLARDPNSPPEFFILKFSSGDTDSSGIACLWWMHEPDLPEPGEIFAKINQNLNEDAVEL
ncbi:hypothetical protein Hte_008460 [Hypoxylon texense]